MLIFQKKLVDTETIDCRTIGRFYGVNGKKLQRQYRDYLSDFKAWEQKSHAKEWLLFPQNLGEHVSLDETAFSNGDLYTILTNLSST